MPPALAVLVHVGLLAHGDLIYDDPNALERARTLAEGPFIGFFTALRGSLPLSLHFDSLVWGRWIPGYRLTNLLLHALATLLVVPLGTRVARDRRVGLASGLLFAVHPVHVEAVASLENRKDLLAMIAVAGILLVHLRTLQSGSRSGRAVGRALVFLLFVAGVLWVKEIAVAGLVVMLPLASWLWRGEAEARTSRRAWLLAGALALTAALLAWQMAGNLFHTFSPQSVLVESDGVLFSYGDVLRMALAAVPEHLRLLFYPRTLSVDYPVRADLDFWSAPVLAGVALLAAWGLFIVLAASRSRPITFAAAWMLAMLAPTQNLIPVGHFFVAERYLYVPSFGVCVLAGLAVSRLSTRRASAGRRRLVTVAFVCLIACGAARSVLRVRDWSSVRALFAASLAAGIESYRIHTTLGHAQLLQGESAEAQYSFERAVQLFPRALRPRFDLGMILAARGEFDRAAMHFEACLRTNPAHHAARVALADILCRMGRHGESLLHYRLAAWGTPGDGEVLLRISAALAASGDRAGAIAQFQALADSRAAGDPLRRRAEIGLLLSLLDGPDDAEARQAVALARRLAAASDFADPSLLFLLARGEAALGRQDQALELALRARGLLAGRTDDPSSALSPGLEKFILSLEAAATPATPAGQDR